MATILTPEQINFAKGFIHDIVLAATPGRQPTAPRSKFLLTGYSTYVTFIPNAKIIFKGLIERRCETNEFNNYVSAINTLAGYPVVPWDAKNYGSPKKKQPEMLSKYIVWFCDLNNLLWDDSNTSTYEMDQIKSNVLGAALWKGKCFVSQRAPKTGKSSKVTSTASATTASSASQQSTQTSQQLSPFKARGALSSVALDLIGTPGQKVYLQGTVYCILGSDANGKILEDCAYIRPVEDVPPAKSKYAISDGQKFTNKVLFGKAKGNGYCTCFFNNITDANTFLQKLNTKNISNSNIANISVYSKKAVPNGYYEIGTEFGSCFISAAKLNEEFDTTLQEELISESDLDKAKKFDDLFLKFN